MLRNIVAAVILVPLAAVIIAFAVANRNAVTVSLDPFGSNPPAASVTLPLFGLIIASLIVGVVVGGAASWLRQSKWRRAARRAEREAAELRREIATLRPAAEFGTAGEGRRVPERLQLKPPL